MQRCSYFIKGKALFGGFPTQEEVENLEKENVRVFVDLTFDNEKKTTPYTTKYKYIKYTIKDHKIPEDLKSFSVFIIKICKILEELPQDEKIYVHCKGGHGRSGVVVACILCYYHNIPPHKALTLTSEFHSKRPEMKDKWRKIGSPQNNEQRNFVKNFFKPLKFGNIPYLEEISQGFNDDDPYPVVLEIKGETYKFSTASQALQKMYLLLPEHWESNKKYYMYEIMYNKFTQNPTLKENLMKTGLRPLIKISKDLYWGCGKNDKGLNMMGDVLSILRRDFYLE